MLYVCIYVAPWSCEARHFAPLYVPTCSGMTIKLNLNLNLNLTWSDGHTSHFKIFKGSFHPKMNTFVIIYLPTPFQIWLFVFFSGTRYFEKSVFFFFFCPYSGSQWALTVLCALTMSLNTVWLPVFVLQNILTCLLWKTYRFGLTWGRVNDENINIWDEGSIVSFRIFIQKQSFLLHFIRSEWS